MKDNTLNSEEVRIFNDQVRSEAHRRAQQNAGGRSPEMTAVNALIPVVRIELMAKRKKTLIDRVAGGIAERISALMGERAAAEQEVQNLVELQKQHAVLVASGEAEKENLKRMDQTAEAIRQSVASAKTDIVKYYTGQQGGNTDPASNVISSYREIAAGEAALAAFPSVRRELETSVARIEASIAEFETKHAALFAA